MQKLPFAKDLLVARLVILLLPASLLVNYYAQARTADNSAVAEV